MNKNAVLAIGVLLLSSCSSWQANNFVPVNWYEVGYQEAKSGFTQSWRENYHAYQGSKHETFDLDAYQKGFHDGKVLYCQETHLTSGCPQKPQLSDTH